MIPTFHVKNFDKFQHYKDRAPPWIKLYNELLDDYEFACLQDASKLHLILIWLLASRSANKLPYDSEWVSKRINATSRVDLEALVKSGFLVLDQPLPIAEHNASTSLADCLPRDRDRDREETEKNSEAYASAGEPADEDPKAKLFRVGKTTLVSFGVAEKRTGALIGQWLKERPDPVGLLAAIQYSRDQNVADPVAYISALVHGKDQAHGRKNGLGKTNLSELAFDLADEMQERIAAAGLGGSPRAR